MSPPHEPDFDADDLSDIGLDDVLDAAGLNTPLPVGVARAQQDEARELEEVGALGDIAREFRAGHVPASKRAVGAGNFETEGLELGPAEEDVAMGLSGIDAAFFDAPLDEGVLELDDAHRMDLHAPVASGPEFRLELDPSDAPTRMVADAYGDTQAPSENDGAEPFAAPADLQFEIAADAFGAPPERPVARRANAESPAAHQGDPVSPADASREVTPPDPMLGSGVLARAKLTKRAVRNPAFLVEESSGAARDRRREPTHPMPAFDEDGSDS